MPDTTKVDDDLLLRDYRPRPHLVTKATHITQPRYPVYDAHNHLGETFGGGWINRPVAALLDRLDEAGVRVYVDLDGGWGEDILQAHLDRIKAAAPARFRVFSGVDWRAWPERGDGFATWAAERLRAQAAWGRGRPQDLEAVRPPSAEPGGRGREDRRRPARPHLADGGRAGPACAHPRGRPGRLLRPAGRRQRALGGAARAPRLALPSPPYPAFLAILEDLARLVARHPGTTFIGAHVGCYAEDLAWVGALLDRCPNFYVDFSARIAELGRQPYSARRFFIQYADRILFGTDSEPDLDTYRIYYRFLKPTTSTSTTAPRRPRRRDAGRFTACTCPTTCWKRSITATRRASSG
ncbi:MAG: amidohydrolase family protein [Anaerolineae bacterium]|nr:amidohydrolase family protein [Anaerolineae bacterium]